MELSAAAAYFDSTVCADAFTPYSTFYGQLDVFDDSRRDGTTVARRILSVEPSVTVPARRVISMAGDYWIIGTHEADVFRGDVIRDKWVLHKAQGPASIRTPAETLAGATGIATYAARVWVKDMKELDVSSRLTPFYNIYLPSTDAVVVGNIIEIDGDLHIVRGTMLSVAGFTVAESDELGAATLVAGCSYTEQTYAPATDTYSASTPVSLSVLSMRFQDDYTYPNSSVPKMEPGDRRALLLKSAVTPSIRGTLAISGVVWRILDVQSEDATSWAVHLRLP